MDAADLYARAGRIFDDVVDLAGPVREARLAELEEQDPEAVQLARQLVAQDAEPSPFGISEFSDEDPAGVLGAKIGPHEVEALLGRGGMGAVYLARRRNPDARVAIKFVSLSAVTATSIERFRSETELLASLEHPGIVRYRDSGVDRGGRPYLVMDYVAGEPLSHSIDEVATSVELTVELVVAIADAVHHLHQRGVLHRDLKPSNILVRREDGVLVPTLIDFGIARTLTDSQLGPNLDLTGEGLIGTPAYMSPEQSRGGAPPDVRTDVHALGAVLYALLTGHPPRDLDRITSGDPIEIHSRLRETEARPPSQRVDPECFGAERARQRKRQVDRDLDAVVVKALALEADQRYASVEALAADLRRWLGHRPVRARRIGAAGRMWKTVRRHPLESALSVASVILLATTAVWASVARARETNLRRQYAEQLATTETVHRFYTEDVFGRASPDQDGPDTPVIDVLRTAASSVGDRLDDEPALVVALRGSLAGVFERLGAAAEADEQLARAEALVRDLPADHPQRMRYDLERGVLLANRNQYAEAEELLRELYARLQAAPVEMEDVEGWCSNMMALVLTSQNELEEAQLWLDRAFALLARDDPRYFELLNNRALLAWENGDLPAAQAALEELLEVLVERFGEQHPYTGGICTNLAGLHLDRDAPKEALPYARRGLEILVGELGPTHPDVFSTMNQLASCHSMLGEYEPALELRQAVVNGRRERFGSQNASVGTALSNLASTLVGAGRAEEALEPAREAVSTLESTLGEHPFTAKACLALARAHAGRGEQERALELVDHALAIYAACDGDQSAFIESASAYRAKLVGGQ